MDPLAEKYYDMSPDAHCGNNPIRFIDPDGRKNRKAGPYENPSSATTGSSVGKVTAASSKITSTGARIIENSNESYGNFNSGMNKDGVGFSYHLNPNFSTGRTDLRIHPDGNREGTQGCIGLSGNSVELNSFKGVINSTL